MNRRFVEGSSFYKGEKAYTRAEALDYYREAAAVATKPFIYSERGRRQCGVRGEPEHGDRSRHGLFGSPVRARHMERRHADLRHQGRKALEDWLSIRA